MFGWLDLWCETLRNDVFNQLHPDLWWLKPMGKITIKNQIIVNPQKDMKGPIDHFIFLGL